MLDVRRLRVLVAISEHGGVSAAARALLFTPPAVSQQVAALERQLGVQLLDRSQRNARLTSAGARLAEHARQVIAGLEAAEADVIGTRPAARGLLRLATMPSTGRMLVPGIIGRLAKDHPEIELRIDVTEPEAALPALARQETDAVLAAEYGLTPRRLASSIERVDLFDEQMYVAIPASSAILGPDVELAEFRDARWIAPAERSACALALERSCALAGYEPHVVSRTADFAVAASFVAAGYGMTLLPAMVADDLRLEADRRHIRLLTSIDPPISRTVYLALRHGSRARPAIAALLDCANAEADPRGPRRRVGDA
jgi:DNA-binding transcriptional LysR family regulator